MTFAELKASLARHAKKAAVYAKRAAKERGLVRRRRRQIHTAKAATANPTRMYDSTSVDQIPANAEAVAGYIGGHWPTFASLPAKFPHARHVSIAVASRFDAEVLDVEPGDATNDVAAGWVRTQQKRGLKKPCVYTAVSNANALLAALSKAGIKRSDIRLWTAHYLHTPHLCGPKCGFGMPTTADATQFTDKALGRTLDESVCAPSFWAGR